MLALIDNYDSFSHNLARYFVELGVPVDVYRNDQITVADLLKKPLQGLVISPGPCSPDQAGISLEAINQFADRVPILGVCLGHQAIGQVFGAKVVRAKRVMHGKTSVIEHAGAGLFSGLSRPLTVTRYHSLTLAAQLPECLVVDAWVESTTSGYEIMSVRHRHRPIYGVQFHPESVMTDQGHQLLGNFLADL